MSPSILLKRFLGTLVLCLLMVMNLQAQTSHDLTDLKNYVKAKDKLHTCGKIDEVDLQIIKARDIKTVISLNTASPSKVIVMQQKARSLGLNYLHVPVSWKSPSLESLKLFFKYMDENPEADILVYCRLNWRASAFVYLYRILRLNEEESKARAAMANVWNPDKNTTWSQFIKEARDYFESN